MTLGLLGFISRYWEPICMNWVPWLSMGRALLLYLELWTRFGRATVVWFSNHGFISTFLDTFRPPGPYSRNGFSEPRKKIGQETVLLRPS